jgi:putative transposase
LVYELRNYRFRLYPTDQQETRLVETLDGCRWLYNYFLMLPPMSEYDMNYTLTELKEQKPWLRNYHSKMLQMVGKQVAANMKALKALQKNGHRIGKLHYMTHREYNSFTYNQSGFKLERHGNTDLLWLSKIGYVEIRLHRKPVNIKQVTVTNGRNGKWYAVIACELAKPMFKIINPAKAIGIDVGIKNFAYDSGNHVIENPLYLTKMLKPLRRANRILTRRKKNSNNYEKAKSRLQILHERIRNKRNDFLHKTSRYYSNTYDIIFLERLRMLNMVKNHKLARHILDSGWRTFKQMLEYKAKFVVEVEPRNTSVNCSRCGNQIVKSLAIRTYRCDKCDLVIDRDYNASLNIKRRGLLLLPQELREVTPVEIAWQSRDQEEATELLVASSQLARN